MGPRRTPGHGLAVLVASEDALDQYFMREPEALLGRRVEAAILDHANPRVLDGHVRAAAFEAPLDDDDRAFARRRGARARGRPPRAEGARRAATSGTGATTRRRAPRSARRALTRSPSSTPTTGALLGVVERERAYSTVHEGAVYLHLGETYLVLELDLEARTALVEPFRGDYYTQPKKETTTAIEEALRARAASSASSSRSATSR